MLNIFNNKKQHKNYFLDFISKSALPSFRDGKIGYAVVLHSVFALDDEKQLHIEVANAYVGLLSQNTIKKLVYIEENCRCYVDYYGYDSHSWRPDWKNTDMSRARFNYLSNEQYIAVLKLGTFHADGYCRQRCMEELCGYADTLPFFMLRMNDWVEEIREKAFELACGRLEVCDIYELSSAMPMLEKLRNSRRRKSAYLNKIEEFFTQNIASKMSTLKLDEVHTYDIAIKNAIYRFVNKNRVLSLEAMEELLHYEKESYGKRLITRGILYQYDCDFERIQGYLKSKNGMVRYETLVYWYYTKIKEPWEGLETLLMDRVKRIRLEAGYILEKHKVLDVLDYYKSKLANEVSATAIYGIGEHGGSSDIELIKPYFEDEDTRLVKAALSAYMSIAAEKGEDLYWKYLLDERASVCKRAYHAIRKYDIHYGAKTLYDEFLKNDNELTRAYLLELICVEPSTWGRLPYLLRLWGRNDIYKQQGYRISLAIDDRSMYASITKDEAQEILDILDELAKTKPILTVERIRKPIEFDLQFVSK